jgi:hypothetical protein
MARTQSNGSEDSQYYTLASNLPLASASENARGFDLPGNGQSLLLRCSKPPRPTADLLLDAALAYTLHQTAQLEGLLTILRDTETSRCVAFGPAAPLVSLGCCLSRPLRARTDPCGPPSLNSQRRLRLHLQQARSSRPTGSSVVVRPKLTLSPRRLRRLA